MFSKAHVAGYVMNSVRMAWYKIHYPTEFYAAYLSCFNQTVDYMDEKDKHLRFTEMVDECSKRGIQLLEPDAEKSHNVNYLPEGGNIRMPCKQ